jgi:outer membrane protein assembly factor BamB
MPNAGDTRAIYCPSCGASVEMAGNTGSCMYCGTTIERQQSTGENPRFTVTQANLGSPPASSYSTFNQPVARRSPMLLFIGIAVSLACVVVAGAAGLLLYLGGRAVPSTPPIVGSLVTAVAEEEIAEVGPSPVTEQVPLAGDININELIAGLPRDGVGEDLLAYVNNSGDQGLSVVLIDGGSLAPRWQSQPFSKELYQGHSVVGQDMLYLTDHERLLALRLSDGTVAWEAALVAEPNCDECMRLVKNHIVVVQKDGSIQGFDARNGQRSWSITQDDPPRKLPVIGDRLMLLQPADRNGKLISLIDPASGKEVQQIEPTCPNESFPDQVERPDLYSPMLFTADGKTMYTTFGFFSHCAQGWDLASGKKLWQTPLDDDVPSSWGGDGGQILTEDAIVFGFEQGDEGALWALDTAGGELRKLVAKKKYRYIPVAARDGVVIALTWPTWDTDKQLLVGLDAKTGEQRWEFKPLTTDARITESHGHLDLRLTRKGLLVVQVLEEQQQLLVETLDPKTGTSADKQVTTLEGSGSHVFWDALWSTDMAWLDIGSQVYAIDLGTGATRYRLD